MKFFGVKMRYLAMLIVAAFSFSPSSVYGDGPAFTGSEEQLWEGHRIVVIAKIGQIKPIETNRGECYSAMLQLMRRIAGPCDPSSMPTLPVTFCRRGDAEMPHDGNLILAVISVDLTSDRTAWKTNVITEEDVAFMPDKQAMLILADMNDPRIDEVLKKIQAARARPRHEPRR